jgi:hypothetical protein
MLVRLIISSSVVLRNLTSVEDLRSQKFDHEHGIPVRHSAYAVSQSTINLGAIVVLLFPKRSFNERRQRGNRPLHKINSNKTKSVCDVQNVHFKIQPDLIMLNIYKTLQHEQ